MTECDRGCGVYILHGAIDVNISLAARPLIMTVGVFVPANTILSTVRPNQPDVGDRHLIVFDCCLAG